MEKTQASYFFSSWFSKVDKEEILNDILKLAVSNSCHDTPIYLPKLLRRAQASLPAFGILGSLLTPNFHQY